MSLKLMLSTTIKRNPPYSVYIVKCVHVKKYVIGPV